MPRPCITWLLASLCWLVPSRALAQEATPPLPFGIRVVDEETRRGVPLVSLVTTHGTTYVTDSQGWVALDEPGLLGQKVFFFVRSHGYGFQKDGFGYAGRALDVEPGGRATLTVTRHNIAERLYRVTGEGIHVHAVRLGLPVPLEHPLLNAQVAGQDSVQATVYRGRLSWFWGDTSRLRYPLGHFGTAGATSALPGKGGLDPTLGVDLRYFAGDDGFSRPMFQLDAPGMVWIDGLFTLDDPDGQERLLCHYARMKDLGTRLAHGIAVFDDATARFRPLRELGGDTALHPQGHAFRVTEASGETFITFATPYPFVRVRARWEDALDPDRYEAYTPLVPGQPLDRKRPSLDRGDDKRLRHAWKRSTAPLLPPDHQALVDKGVIDDTDTWTWPTDTTTGAPVRLHGGSVRHNAHRGCYIMIAVAIGGTSSFLGEVYYLEAPRPEGPWHRATKIVTHDRYSFYNPTHHPFFDQDGGRVIHFEGTYTHTFSGNDHPTPRYDYNQIMYRLDLDDPRLKPAHRD